TLRCDLFLAIGSSLVVWPAAGFPMLAKRNGARLVILNREPTEFDDMADLVVHDDIGTVLEPFAAGRGQRLPFFLRLSRMLTRNRVFTGKIRCRKRCAACSRQQVLHVVDSCRKLNTCPRFCALFVQGQCYLGNTRDSLKRP